MGRSRNIEQLNIFFFFSHKAIETVTQQNSNFSKIYQFQLLYLFVVN